MKKITGRVQKFKEEQNEKIHQLLANLGPAFDKFEALFKNGSLSRKELHKQVK